MVTGGIDALSSGNVSGSMLMQKNRVTGDEFLQLLVTQLRHQDPLEPLSSEQLMTQLAQFQSLEELMKMNSYNERLLAGQQLAAASALMGKYVAGVSNIFGPVEGTVDRIYVDGVNVYLEVDGYFLRVEEVIEVVGEDDILE